MKCLPAIDNFLIVAESMKTLIDADPSLTGRLNNATKKYFKGAQVSFTDSLPYNELKESASGAAENKPHSRRYVSSSALESKATYTRMWHMSAVGFKHEDISPECASLVLPFKINLQALLPAGLTQKQINTLLALFNSNFQERIRHQNKLGEEQQAVSEDFIYSIPFVLFNRIWPTWFRPKQSFRQDPWIGNPQKQICSTLLAQDLWKSLQIVDCQLDMWGIKEPLKNPYGDYQRLDAMLPGDLLKCGIEHGWLTHVHHPEVEKLIRTPRL